MPAPARKRRAREPRGQLFAFPGCELPEPEEADMIVRSAQRPSPVAPVTASRPPEAAKPAKVWPPTKGMPPSIEMRHPNELQIDATYQRSTDSRTSQSLIGKIAREWDWRMCMPLVVSRRADAFYVIDGQHRHAAALLRGDIQYLPCVIATYASVADEAAMFVALNRVRRAITRLDDFHAAVAGGEETATRVRGLILAAGFTVSRHTGSQTWVPGEVAFTSSIGRIMRKHGEKVCADALGLLRDTFPGVVLYAGASLFVALTKVAVAGTCPDRDRLGLALLERDQKGWSEFMVRDTKIGTEERGLLLKKELIRLYEEQGA